MTDDPKQAALAVWAAKDLPARLLAEQVAKLLNCSTEDVAILVSAGKLRALSKPRPNAVKFFSSIELIGLLADPDWLDEATKTISQNRQITSDGSLRCAPFSLLGNTTGQRENL
jgi:hypothetical protein